MTCPQCNNQFSVKPEAFKYLDRYLDQISQELEQKADKYAQAASKQS